ncbi:hypothetical protein D3C71_489330 [compost metagenome]
MTFLHSFIEGIDEPSARASLYYVSRYVKQAGYFEEYKKDVFEDEYRSIPSEAVKDLARRMIAALEEREGVPATSFSAETVLQILREITALEAELGPEPTERHSARVESFLQALEAGSRKS